MDFGQVSTKADGSFSFSIHTSDSWPTGVYRIVVAVGSDKGSAVFELRVGGGGGGGDSSESCTDCDGAGGGGGHGSIGSDGDSSTQQEGGTGGDSYGRADLPTLYFGSGGGAGGLDTSAEAGIGGAGGAGGGIILIIAAEITISGDIVAYGDDGALPCNMYNDYCGTAASSEADAGGAGAGGTIYLICDALTAATNSILAGGGAGQLSNNDWNVYSGDGSDGRIRLDFLLLNGYATDTVDAESEADAVCEPDPGWLAAPGE